MMRKYAGMSFNKEVLKTFLSITPLFPEGSTVRVTRGKYNNYIGIVTSVNTQDLSRPEIRLIMNNRKTQIKPVAINLLKEKLISIESILL